MQRVAFGEALAAGGPLDCWLAPLVLALASSSLSDVPSPVVCIPTLQDLALTTIVPWSSIAPSGPTRTTMSFSPVSMDKWGGLFRTRLRIGPELIHNAILPYPLSFQSSCVISRLLAACRSPLIIFAASLLIRAGPLPLRSML